MCFKPPKPPPVHVDAELARQSAEQRDIAIEEKAKAKRQRAEEAISALGGKFGRNSLITGMSGGQGFAAPIARSLFMQTGGAS